MKTIRKHRYPGDRLVFGLTLILSITGIISWLSINEQEDPFFPYRNGVVTISAANMSASGIEQSLIEPLERALAAIEDISAVTSRAAEGVASVDIELHESIYETDRVWQRIRDVVSRQNGQHTAFEVNFTLQERAQDTAGILFSIESDKPLTEIRRFAMMFRDQLYTLPEIRHVRLVGDPEEEIQVSFSQRAMLELGLSPREIAAQIAAANTHRAAGSLEGEAYQQTIPPITRLERLEDIEQVGIQTVDGELLTLREVAAISLVNPPIASESFWLNGARKIGVSVTIPPNQLRVVEFGEKLKDFVARFSAKHPDYLIETVFFQPEWSERRRGHLLSSLLYSCTGVGIVLFLLMGRNLALAVSVTIPAIALTAVALFGMFGGVLHQMSIAGLVLSLGLMVDNSIVIAERIARLRGEGLSASRASGRAVRELYKPLATSTLTTLAAFVPMLLAEGNVADFIRMIPVVVSLAIILSYLYALVLLPLIANKMSTFSSRASLPVLTRIAERVAIFSITRPRLIFACFLTCVAMAIFGSVNTPGEFFPKSSRNQAYIDIEGDFGLSHSATLKSVREVEAILAGYSEITDVISFVGHSGPRFYYNLPERPNESNIARVVFTTERYDQVKTLVEALNVHFAQTFPGTRIRAREIGQGPPIEAPLEIRILGEDRTVLRAASEDISMLVSRHDGTVDVRRGYATAKPRLTLAVDEHMLHKAGVSKGELSDYVAWRSSGWHVTRIPLEREQVDVVLRDLSAREGGDRDHIMSSYLITNKGDLLPISLFMTTDYEAGLPVLSRRNGFKSHVIYGDVRPHLGEAEVIDSLAPALREIEDKYGVRLEFGGEMEAAAESSSALVKVFPVGLILLFTALILQFNSVSLAATVLISVPFALVGVFPMLSLVGVNFGFMAMLGMLALVGISVNTAIILIDRVVVLLRDTGRNLSEAIQQAVSERFRPVLLTTLTTIIGMLPLTSPESPLWPPLAWAVIGGLISSTILTLVVLPLVLLVVINPNKIRSKIQA